MRPTRDNVEVRRLRNGLTVVVDSQARSDFLAIMTRVEVGYLDESDAEVGIAHLLEHLVAGRSSAYGWLGAPVIRDGGYLSASTIYDHTRYLTVARPDALPEMLEAHAARCFNLRFSDLDLTAQILSVCAESERKAADASTANIERLYARLFPYHRMGRWRIGRPDHVRRFSSECVRTFHQRWYAPNRSIVAIVGNIHPHIAHDAARRAFSSLPIGATVSRSSLASAGMQLPSSHSDPSSGEVHVAMGWKTVPLNRRAEAAGLSIIAELLGHREHGLLTVALRSQGIACDVTASSYAPRNIGVFVLALIVPRESRDHAVAIIFSELRRLALSDISSDAASLAKERFQLNWEGVQNDVHGRALALSEWQAHGDWQLAHAFLKAVLAIDVTSIRQLIERFLLPEYSEIAMQVVGPQEPSIASAPR